MFAFLATAAFFAAAPEDKPKPADNTNTPAVSLDGNWTILAAEKDGKPMPEAKNMTVTAKGDTITCSGKDGKPATTMKVAFGPNGTVTVHETNASAGDAKPVEKKGVYVLTDNYFSLCVCDCGDKAGAEPTNKCTFVLNRTGAQPNRDR